MIPVPTHLNGPHLPGGLRRADLVPPPPPPPPRPQPVDERFWRLVHRRAGADQCWLWRGRVNRDGFGVFRTWRGTKLAHRVAWVLTRGDLPNGVMLRRRCAHGACVRPTHHEQWPTGRMKLDPDRVRALRAEAAAGVPKPALRSRYRISPQQLDRILRRECWREVA
jgi:hypothetical protein